jgi:hypothetical protein
MCCSNRSLQEAAVWRLLTASMREARSRKARSATGSAAIARSAWWFFIRRSGFFSPRRFLFGMVCCWTYSTFGGPPEFVVEIENRRIGLFSPGLGQAAPRAQSRSEFRNSARARRADCSRVPNHTVDGSGLANLIRVESIEV